MPLPYGFAKATVTGGPKLVGKPGRGEVQYHLHAELDVGRERWDVAINVGTDDATDLLFYKLVEGFRHPITGALAAAGEGRNDLTGTAELPALDFQRSDILEGTGAWRKSDVMDGSLGREPAGSIRQLLTRARDGRLTIYLFGRFYGEGNGIHDTHMNQGSRGRYLHRPGSGSRDQNDVWQDGALLVDLDDGSWTAYFAAFQQQFLPTDELGNPLPGATPVG